MTILLLSIPGLALMLLYCLKMLRYAFALSAIEEGEARIPDDCKLKISVIVPVRNEITSLPDLLADLQKQDYPLENHELIFVDDHSEDGSAEYLEERCRTVNNWGLHRLSVNSKGKKQALHEGILRAGGGWILQTDADCRIPEGFISGHATKACQEESLLISGPVFSKSTATLWSKLVALEHMSLSGTGIASFLIGDPMLCSAANLSYSKKFYLEVAEKLLQIPSPSGDDVFLMIEAKKHKGKMSVLTSPNYVVETEPAQGPVHFFKQRIRWGAKSRYYTDPGLKSLALLVFLVNFLLSAGLVSAIFYPPVFWYFLAAFLLKSCADFFVLYFTASTFKLKQHLWIFPLLSLFYYFYVTLAAFISLMGSYAWKGRKK